MPCPVGALRTPTQLPHMAQRRRQSGTLAVARLGGEHHTHSRAARKPILPRAFGAGTIELDRLCWLQLLPQSLRCSLVTDLNRSAPRSRLVLRKNPPRHPFPPISIVPAERAEAMVPRSSHPRRTFGRLILQSNAAFLQNASVWCVAYPGFYPGLVCRAPLGLSSDPLNHPTWHNAGGKAGPWP